MDPRRRRGQAETAQRAAARRAREVLPVMDPLPWGLIVTVGGIALFGSVLVMWRERVRRR